MIDIKIIERLADFKYPDLSNRYGLTDEAIIKLFKIYKKEIDINVVIDILEYNYSSQASKQFVINIIEQVFKDMNSIIDDNVVRKLSPHFYNNKDLIRFIHSISDCDDIFSGGDIKEYGGVTNELLNCRSYKIYKITNG